MQNLTGYDLALVVGAPLWVFGWLAASAIVRLRRGKAIFAKAPAGARFVQKGASGSSGRDLLTRLGGARNCLMVAVDEDSLTVLPTFPFTLLFLPEIYDLEHRIPLERIRSVEEEISFFGRGLLVTFLRPNGEARTLDLRVRDHQGLLRALGY